VCVSAAAYSQQGDHEKAVQDAEKAVEIDPKYSKAYSRMGHAYFCLNKYEEAVDAYEKGLELDPNNATLKSSLATAQSKITSGSIERSTEPSPAAGGLPNLGGAGGMPDLGSLLNNPALMNMAQQMMQSGALDGLMNNPNIARM
jgi:small glutamine-rich tetratricopeptide repeat-containing protein alpha